MPKRNVMEVSGAVPTSKSCNSSSDTGTSSTEPKAKKISTSAIVSKAIPKSVTDKIIFAIRFLRSNSGSSALAIHKTCIAECQYDNLKAIKKALQTGVTSGLFEQNKMSYLVKGDEVYEDTADRVTIEDLLVPTGGIPVVRGDTCTISYVGTLQDTGAKFESASSFTFTVGAGDVIKGMDTGVLGMVPGGKRLVKIPASLGYGKRGSGPDIPPNTDLCFQFTLKSVS